MKTNSLVFLIFNVIAIADGVYLSILHFLPGVLVCPNAGVIDCARVLGSSYSSILGVPLAFIGLVWGAGMLLLYLKRNGISEFMAPIWYLLGILGVVYSFSAQYLIGKICIYCTTLDISIIILVLLGIFSLKLHKKAQQGFYGK